MATTPKIINGNLITDADPLAVEALGIAPAAAAIGATTDAPFVGTENATARTVISLLKGIKNSIYVSLLAILGATTGAAVVTDANGTIQQYLRGLVTLLIGTLKVVSSGTRGTTVLHRNAITAVDKIVDFVDASMTVANVAGVQGSLVFNTTYKLCAVPGNRWGSCLQAAAIDSVLVTNDAASTHVVDLTIAQAVGAEWYELFLSVDAAPKLVGRLTEAQRAAGGFEILTMGTVTVNAGVAAGHVYIGVVGTGQATTAANFIQNNAYRPALATAYDAAGYSRVKVHVKLVLTDLRTAPALTIIPFFQNQLSAGDWHQGNAEVVNVLQALGQSLEQTFVLDVNGSAFVILVGVIAGQGAACSIWLEPA